jgi:hypothetical protein
VVVRNKIKIKAMSLYFKLCRSGKWNRLSGAITSISPNYISRFLELIFLTGLQQTTYIAIGAGSGVTLILLVVLVVICLRFEKISSTFDV